MQTVMHDILVKKAHAEFYDIDIDNTIKIPANFISLDKFIALNWGESNEDRRSAEAWLMKQGYLDKTGYPSKFSMDENLIFWYNYRNPGSMLFEREDAVFLITSKGQLELLEDLLYYREFNRIQKENQINQPQ